MSHLTTKHSFTLTILCTARLGCCIIISFKLFRNLHLEFASLAFPRKKVIQPTWTPRVVLLFSERKASQTNSSPPFSELVSANGFGGRFLFKNQDKSVEAALYVWADEPFSHCGRVKGEFTNRLG